MQLKLYNKMLLAIDHCHRVDEIKAIHDTALALEKAAEIAKNTDAERRACEIRLRAEKHAGLLLHKMARSGERATRQTARKVGSSNAVKLDTLSDLGISKAQSARWQALANVPTAEFEAALNNDSVKPTTSGILKKANGAPGKVHAEALWFWGRLRDAERMKIWDWKSTDILGEMTDTMQADVQRIVPELRDWLKSF